MKSIIVATKYHDISCGHRVVGQGGKCEQLHGHNYRIHFGVSSIKNDRDGTLLDHVGRVMDFSDISKILCHWVEVNWDHKFLMWDQDPWLKRFNWSSNTGIIPVSFNPTAENMAQYLFQIADKLLPDHIQLVECKVEETRKCSALCVRSEQGEE